MDIPGELRTELLAKCDQIIGECRTLGRLYEDLVEQIAGDETPLVWVDALDGLLAR